MLHCPLINPRWIGQGPCPGSVQSGRRATCHARGAVRQHEVADTLYSTLASVPMVTKLSFSPINTLPNDSVPRAGVGVILTTPWFPKASQTAAKTTCFHLESGFSRNFLNSVVNDAYPSENVLIYSQGRRKKLNNRVADSQLCLLLLSHELLSKSNYSSCCFDINHRLKA